MSTSPLLRASGATTFLLRAMLIALLTITAAVPAGAEHSKAAREVVESMIAAHGGMERWANAPAVSFEDEFKQGEATEGGVSRVTVEQGPRRAYIDFPDTEMRMAWNGEKAWSENWGAPMPPRFLALLNYYFLNLPWLTLDPGVHLGEPATARLWDEPTEYVTVKMTFDEGVGDTPDDYYILYIHPETHRLAATEYTVTYTSLLPEGVESTPPHILVFDEHETVGGLVVPTHYTIYETDRSVYGSCEVRDWSFSRSFDTGRMKMPEGAVLDTSAP